MRYKLAALEAAADTMLQRLDEVDRANVREIRTELAEILAKLDDALEP